MRMTLENDFIKKGKMTRQIENDWPSFVAFLWWKCKVCRQSMHLYLSDENSLLKEEEMSSLFVCVVVGWSQPPYHDCQVAKQWKQSLTQSCRHLGIQGRGNFRSVQFFYIDMYIHIIWWGSNSPFIRNFCWLICHSTPARMRSDGNSREDWS